MASVDDVVHAPGMRFLVFISVIGMSAAGCNVDKTPVEFSVPRSELGEPFLLTPWPSDLLRKEGGLDLLRFPNPYGSSALEDALGLIATNPGYAASMTMYFRVNGGVDESSLPPTAGASLAANASLFVVDVVTLARVPISWSHYPDGTSFLPPGTVAVQPLLGAYARNRYALIATSAARAADGKPLGASDDLRRLLRCEPLENVAAQPDCTPYQSLVAALKLNPDDIALMQIVTPADATTGLDVAAETIRARGAPAYTIDAKRAADFPFDLYDGTVTLAQLQAGTPPYDRLDGTTGGFVLDADGAPVVQRTEDVRFILTVPRAPTPRDGFCVVINGHGTGGNLESGLGADARAEAFQIAQAGCAMLAISEPLHLTRAGYRQGQEEILTFNFFNPVAGRDNWRQSAIEKVQLVSLAQGLAIPAALSGGAEIRFNPDAVSYFGHSQGGINGALFVAVEDRIKGAFLSGAGAGFQASLVEKTDPVAISEVLKTVLLIDDENETIDLFHPVIALLQIWVDPADPLNYGDLWRTRGTHLVVTSGLLDTFTPKRCHGALAAAYGLPIAAPVAEEIEVLTLMGLETAPASLQSNLALDGGTVTGGVLQYGDEGHFAVFNDPGAQSAMRSFFATLQDGAPLVRVR